ncbi:MAG: TIGR03118 family protein [Chloroflexota bacterium]|nr:TIGR03118 family protein [Chloroflexota bacterium]
MRFLRRSLALPLAVALAAAVAMPIAARNINANNAYTVTNLVSDQADVALNQDTNLVNAWGIAASSGSPWWVADNHTNKSTLYRGDGSIVSLVVTVPGGPTGVVFNGTGLFAVNDGTTTASAAFIFDTEGGQVLGWNPAVMGGTDAILGGAHAGAIYKGLALAVAGDSNPYLYAADFHNGAIDVYDSSYALTSLPGDFTDPGIPAGFAPFNIQALGGVLYVTYAMQDADAEDEIAGPGLGYVSEFDTDGNFIGRVASGGDLNAPWGLAIAPADFGRFSGDLLVGNFGDGHINGFGAGDSGWEAKGHLKTPDHHTLVIDGLWGIGFGNDAGSGPHNVLYFAAGPDDEEHGLFGSITAGS